MRLTAVMDGGIFMSKFNTKALCRIAMLAALYVLLNNTIAIKAGNLRITFASLPVELSALLFGPVESALTALLGEFINQLIGGYGITATTALWLIPPAVRGVVVGIAALAFRPTDRPLERRPVLGYAVCVLAALCTTISNTAVIAADAWICGYYSRAYVFGELLYRLGSGMLIAVIVATVALPMAGLLRRQGLARA